jgi:hypothetical protein
MTIEICKKSPNESRHRPVPGEHKPGQAQWEEGPSLTISGRVDQGQGCHHRRRTATEDDQAKKSEK